MQFDFNTYIRDPRIQVYDEGFFDWLRDLGKLLKGVAGNLAGVVKDAYEGAKTDVVLENIAAELNKMNNITDEQKQDILAQLKAVGEKGGSRAIARAVEAMEDPEKAEQAALEKTGQAEASEGPQKGSVAAELRGKGYEIVGKTFDLVNRLPVERALRQLKVERKARDVAIDIAQGTVALAAAGGFKNLVRLRRNMQRIVQDLETKS